MADEQQQQQKRLVSIFDANNSSNTSTTTKGGAQKVKFTPSVPATRNKKEVVEAPVEEKTPTGNNNTSGRRPYTRKQPVSQQPQEVRGIFAEGISTLARKQAPASLSSIIGSGDNDPSSSSRRAHTMEMSCMEPSCVEGAVDMREMFSAITALHSPTIIDSGRFVIEEGDFECVTLPSEGEYFLLQLPPLTKKESKDNNNSVVSGTLRMHESGRTTILVDGREYQVNPIVMNLVDTYKLVSVEEEVAYDYGSVHAKKLAASLVNLN